MPQSADKILDHELLFREPEYQEIFRTKQENFEFNHPDERVKQIVEWTKTEDYKQKNFARDSLTVNPAKACQPLGAVFVANGFHKTLSFVHGSQGCVAYYRSHFSRHFKEPTSCVSSSMTEDAAVFGGMNNMIDGLANAYNLYKPEMIAVPTSCMAEVIGDDLDAFIKNSKQKGSVPEDFDVPFAHTPAFVGSPVTGYDNALLGILKHFWGGKAGTAAPRRHHDGFDLVADTLDQCLWLALLAPKAELVAAAKATLAADADGRRQVLNVGVAPALTVPALFEDIGPRARIPHLWEISSGRDDGSEGDYLSLNVIADRSAGLTQNGVQRLLHPPARLPAWPDEKRGTRLVLITLDMPGDYVQRLFSALTDRPAVDTPDRAALENNPLAIAGR